MSGDVSSEVAKRDYHKESWMNIIDILHGEHRMLLKLFDWSDDLIRARSDPGIIA